MLRLYEWASPHGTHRSSLVENVDLARRQWQQSMRDLDFASGDIIDFIVFNINACERRYMALLMQARAEKVTAWPELKHPVY